MATKDITTKIKLEIPEAKPGSGRHFWVWNSQFCGKTESMFHLSYNHDKPTKRKPMNSIVTPEKAGALF